MSEKQLTEFLPLTGISDRLNVPESWLRSEADAGRIPFLRVGRRRLFDLEAVRAALVERSWQAAHPAVPPGAKPTDAEPGGAR